MRVRGRSALPRDGRTASVGIIDAFSALGRTECGQAQGLHNVPARCFYPPASPPWPRTGLTSPAADCAALAAKGPGSGPAAAAAGCARTAPPPPSVALPASFAALSGALRSVPSTPAPWAASAGLAVGSMGDHGGWASAWEAAVAPVNAGSARLPSAAAARGVLTGVSRPAGRLQKLA